VVCDGRPVRNSRPEGEGDHTKASQAAVRHVSA
jgi:hypothetical protein